jgi:hypothetical protein
MSAETPELTPLEAALAALAPAPARLDRDALRYAAGRAGAGQMRRLRYGLTVGLALAAGLALGLAVAPRRGMQRVGGPALTGQDIGPRGGLAPAAADPNLHPATQESSLMQLAASWDERRPLAQARDPAPDRPAQPAPLLEQDLDLPPGGLHGLLPRLTTSNP